VRDDSVARQKNKTKSGRDFSPPDIEATAAQVCLSDEQQIKTTVKISSVSQLQVTVALRKGSKDTLKVLIDGIEGFFKSALSQRGEVFNPQ